MVGSSSKEKDIVAWAIRFEFRHLADDGVLVTVTVNAAPVWPLVDWHCLL